MSALRRNNTLFKDAGFEVLPCPLCGFAFETRVVAQDPSVHVLGVPEGVAGKPADAEVGFTG